MSHRSTVCEWGFQHSTCRCGSPDKFISPVDCTNAVHKGAKGQYVNEPAIVKFRAKKVQEYTALLESLLS